MEGSKGPAWLREAVATVRGEVVRFMVTVLQCSRHPALFVLALAGALRGLHGGSRLRTFVAIILALVVSGLLLSALHAAFRFSLGVPHFLFRIRRGSPISLWF